MMVLFMYLSVIQYIFVCVYLCMYSIVYMHNELKDNLKERMRDINLYKYISFIYIKKLYMYCMTREKNKKSFSWSKENNICTYKE